MPPINKRLVLAGIAKQTAKGNVATNPAYDFGLLSGAAFAGGLDQSPEEITLDKLTAPGVNRVGFKPSIDFACRAYPALTGILLLAALGADAVTGGSNPYTHTITDATDVAYYTLFGSLGSDYIKLPDCKLDKLVIKWDGPGPIELAPSFMACDFTWLAAPWTPVATQRDTDGRFRGGTGINTLNSTFKLDTDATPAASVQPISKGQIEIANNVDQIILASSIKPSDVAIAERVMSAQVTLVPNDLLQWRRLMTGTAVATAITEVEIYGALEVYFPGDAANHDLKIATPRAAWQGPWPGADPKGGHAELELSADIVLPAAGSSMTATLRNAVATY